MEANQQQLQMFLSAMFRYPTLRKLKKRQLQNKVPLKIQFFTLIRSLSQNFEEWSPNISYLLLIKLEDNGDSEESDKNGQDPEQKETPTESKAPLQTPSRGRGQGQRYNTTWFRLLLISFFVDVSLFWQFDVFLSWRRMRRRHSRRGKGSKRK